jgi:hypothetical protein
MELLRMINGKVMTTKAVISGLARELDTDVRYLEKLAAEIKPDESNQIQAASANIFTSWR